MMRYDSQRFRYLMEESEQALSDAASERSGHRSRVARYVLKDAGTRRLWESRHAELVRPVAGCNRRAPQIFALRKAEIQAFHQRALIDYIRRVRIRGSGRNRLFSVFYGPTETVNAMLTEHRQYLLAVCSRLSTRHLINVMHDRVSRRLLSMYETAYSEYFELYCFVASSDDRFAADAARDAMLEARKTATRIRERLSSARPDRNHGDFDRQILLARSGRYPVLNYMSG